jgi:hypothetical protein
MMIAKKNFYCGSEDSLFGQTNPTVDLQSHLERMLRETIPSQITELKYRAELSLPILEHVSNV